jgi:hypothetical protein
MLCTVESKLFEASDAIRTKPVSPAGSERIPDKRAAHANNVKQIRSILMRSKVIIVCFQALHNHRLCERHLKAITEIGKLHDCRRQPLVFSPSVTFKHSLHLE